MEEMIPKLSGAYYAVRSMVHISNINTLKSIYYTYFHSIIKDGKIILSVTLPTVGRFTKVNCQNYGWCPTQNLLYKPI
jgi:hypothetical protein